MHAWILHGIMKTKKKQSRHILLLVVFMQVWYGTMAVQKLEKLKRKERTSTIPFRTYFTLRPNKQNVYF